MHLSSIAIKPVGLIMSMESTTEALETSSLAETRKDTES
jgi:hypothetical protein